MSGRSSVPEASLRRVRAEFLEMPGLKITLVQAQRLWGFDRATCEDLIAELTEREFLTKTKDGSLILRQTAA
jgi:Fic family protein